MKAPETNLASLDNCLQRRNFRFYSNGAKSAASRSIVSRTDWTSASRKGHWTTSRKEGMVRAELEHHFYSHSLTMFSIQHPDGFHLCHIPMADHVETGHEEVGEMGPLCRHVLGTLSTSTVPRTERRM